MDLKLFYLGIGSLSLIFFVVQTVLAFLGGHADADVDVGGHAGGDYAAPFHAFSVRNLASFMLGFGWGGYASILSGFPTWLTFIVSVVAALFFSYIMWKLMTFFFGFQEDNTTKATDAIGKRCEVYITIGEKKSSSGKVLLALGGARQELSAITDEERDIKPGEWVEVVDVAGNALIVKRT